MNHRLRILRRYIEADLLRLLPSLSGCPGKPACDAVSILCEDHRDVYRALERAQRSGRRCSHPRRACISLAAGTVWWCSRCGALNHTWPVTARAKKYRWGRIYWKPPRRERR